MKASVRTFQVTLTLTDAQIADLGRHLKIRQIEANTGMDTVQIEDRVCMAVFKAARPRHLQTVNRCDPVAGQSPAGDMPAKEVTPR